MGYKSYEQMRRSCERYMLNYPTADVMRCEAIAVAHLIKCVDSLYSIQKMVSDRIDSMADGGIPSRSASADSVDGYIATCRDLTKLIGIYKGSNYVKKGRYGQHSRKVVQRYKGLDQSDR